ncbi:MAG: ATP-binding protein [Ferruginibacter sp.]
MKLFLIIVTTVLLPIFAEAQFDPNWAYIDKPTADSLKMALLTEKNDTLLMAVNRSMGFYYQETKLDSALYYHRKQIELSKKIGLKMWLADAYSQAGYLLYFKGNTVEGYDYFKQAEALAQDEKNEKSNWHYWVFSNSKSLREARLSILAMNYNGLGSLQRLMGNKEKEIEAMEEMRRLGEIMANGKILSTYYGNIAPDLSIDSAIQYTKKAIQYSDAANYKINHGNYLNALSLQFLRQNKIDSALHYAYLSAAAGEEQKSLRALTSTYATLAFLQATVKKNNDSALYYSRKMFSIAKTTQLPYQFKSAYFALAKVFALKKNADSALLYEQLYSNLSDSLNNDQIKQLTEFQKSAFAAQLELKKGNDEKTAYQNKITLYGILGALAAVCIVALILFRNNRQKQKSNKDLESTLSDLKSTQSQLIQSEKMASLGELTAGIAHEIQNPLNFVNNFSEVNKELLVEMKDEMDKGNLVDAKEIANDVIANEEKINHHGKRADAIVKGMLQHSRSSSGVKELTDINALCDEYLRLSYHGLRAKDKSFNATMNTDFDNSIGNINIIPQDIGRVVLNLLTNAFYVVDEKKKASTSSAGQLYEPTVSISTKKVGDKVLISVTDNGNGIPQKVLDKIFQPFFTTKPTGQGTGLGLSLAYDIIKAHGGEIKVQSKEGEGTTFIIKIPIS